MNLNSGFMKFLLINMEYFFLIEINTKIKVKYIK